MPETETELYCVACDHPESEHRNRSAGAFGSGCGHELGRGRVCTCGGFVRPSPRQERSYRRPTFSRTMGRNEIGEGSARHTTNLQGRSAVSIGVDDGKPKSEVPEWVMLGIKNPNSVTIYASTRLSYISLRQEAQGEFEKIHRDMINKGRLEDKPWDLRGRMVGYITATASTYVEALAQLMGQGWRPDGDTEPEGPSTADLQRQAALEDMLRAEAEADRILSIEPVPEPDEDGIYDAEIVDDDDDDV